MVPDAILPVGRASLRDAAGRERLAGELEALGDLLRAGAGDLRRAARPLGAERRAEAERWIREFERDLARVLPRVLTASDPDSGLEPLRHLLDRLAERLRLVFRDHAAAQAIDAFLLRVGPGLERLVRHMRRDAQGAPKPVPPAPTAVRLELSARGLELSAPPEAPGAASTPGDPLRVVLERVMALFGPVVQWRDRLRRRRRGRERPRGRERRQQGDGSIAKPPRSELQRSKSASSRTR